MAASSTCCWWRTSSPRPWPRWPGWRSCGRGCAASIRSRIGGPGARTSSSACSRPRCWRSRCSLMAPFGVSNQASSLVLDALWMITGVAGYRAARQRRFADHRKWMIRNYALAFASIASRFWTPIAVLAMLPELKGRAYQGDTNGIGAIHDVASASAWLGSGGDTGCRRGVHPASLRRPQDQAGLAVARAVEQQVAFAVVAGEFGRALEFGLGLGGSAEFDQQVTADAGQQVVAVQRRSRSTRSSMQVEAGLRTERHGHRDRVVELHDRRRGRPCRAPRRGRRCAPSRCPRRGRRGAWQAAIAACNAYGPCAPPSFSALVNEVRPRLMSSRSHRARFWSSSRIGSPSGPTRAPKRDAWISISETSPCTSGSLGVSSASTRPRRMASAQISGRSQSVPAVAE